MKPKDGMKKTFIFLNNVHLQVESSFTKKKKCKKIVTTERSRSDTKNGPCCSSSPCVRLFLKISLLQILR